MSRRLSLGHTCAKPRHGVLVLTRSPAVLPVVLHAEARRPSRSCLHSVMPNAKVSEGLYKSLGETWWLPRWVGRAKATDKPVRHSCIPVPASRSPSSSSVAWKLGRRLRRETRSRRYGTCLGPSRLANCLDEDASFCSASGLYRRDHRSGRCDQVFLRSGWRDGMDGSQSSHRVSAFGSAASNLA